MIDKIELLPSSDIEYAVALKGGVWISYVKLPWHNHFRVVCEKGRPVFSHGPGGAKEKALRAIIGQWQDKTKGTQNGIDLSAKREAEALFR